MENDSIADIVEVSPSPAGKHLKLEGVVDIDAFVAPFVDAIKKVVAIFKIKKIFLQNIKYINQLQNIFYNYIGPFIIWEH
jgi:hypothetical protein